MQSTPLCASRLAPPKTACGGGVRCTCRRIAAHTEETIRSALKTIRLRFSLGKGELPDLKTADLGKYLLFLLSPRSSRVSTPFPRCQNGWDSHGFPILSRLGRRQRWELAHSVSSVKKGLPSTNCSRHPPPSLRSAWFAKACNPTPPLSDPEYLRFARKITRDVFPLGWDREYVRNCHGFFPKRSSRFDRGFSSEFWSGSSSFKEFQARVQRGGPLPKGVGGFSLRYKDVPAAGKVRAMGIPTYRWDTLGPLHETIYSWLGKQDWMLVGPPTSSRISSVCRFDWQTSIDLVGATDNLRLDVADTVLSALLARCGKVPGVVQLDAVESLHPRVSSQEVTHGQMMGTYLSFPLLCLQSYIAARWATRNVEASILINGDDCLISSPFPVLNSDYPEWAIINESKTGRFRSVAEINSTAFLKEAGGKWREVKHLRRGGGCLDLQGHIHQAAVCRAAGTVWERAFALSKSRSRWCLLPSQLGFDTTVLETFKYERRLRRRGYAVLPRNTGLDDDRYVLRNEPSSVERLEVSLDLWVNGRSFETRHDQLSWSAFSRLIRKPGAARLDARRRGWRGGELSFSTRQVARVPRPRGEVVLAESRLSPEPGPCFEEIEGELYLVLEPSFRFS
ncbi:RNA-dependent RNA polymerase [Erysiphe necator associated ourmia-like virus 83]|nr:RNA-dependent RNA polymerase [Erysiphe necator associated ourmia-like virus 83]